MLMELASQLELTQEELNALAGEEWQPTPELILVPDIGHLHKKLQAKGPQLYELPEHVHARAQAGATTTHQGRHKAQRCSDNLQEQSQGHHESHEGEGEEVH